MHEERRSARNGHEPEQPYPPPSTGNPTLEFATAAVEFMQALEFLARAICEAGCGPDVWRQMQAMAGSHPLPRELIAIDYVERRPHFFGGKGRDDS